jgi:hypothetical protein
MFVWFQRSNVGARLNEYFPCIQKNIFVWFQWNSFDSPSSIHNQSTEGAEFVWVSECQKGEGCEIINQFVFV